MSAVQLNIADICFIISASSVLGFIYGRIFRYAVERELENRVYDLRRHIKSMQDWMDSSR